MMSFWERILRGLIVYYLIVEMFPLNTRAGSLNYADL